MYSQPLGLIVISGGLGKSGLFVSAQRERNFHQEPGGLSGISLPMSFLANSHNSKTVASSYLQLTFHVVFTQEEL
jgi:hypothetical protein